MSQEAGSMSTEMRCANRRHFYAVSSRACAWTAEKRLGPRPPRPRLSPASYMRRGQDSGAADRRRRRRPGSTRAPSGRGLLLFGRMDGAKADLDPVPGVDLRDQQGELHLLILSEVPAQRI